MKLQQTPNLSLQQSKINKANNNIKNNTCTPSFKGAGVDAFMNFLQTNQAMGATAVDVSCMGMPRTIVDATRSPQAGVETARREFTSTINDALLGVYGAGAAMLVSQGINKEYGIKANNLTIDNNALDIMTSIRANSGDIRNSENLNKYLDEILDNTKVYSPNSSNAVNGAVTISKEAKAQVKENIIKELNNADSNKGSLKSVTNRISSILIGDTGSETRYALSKELPTGVDAKTAIKTSEASVSDYAQNILKVSKAFMSDKVSKTFDGAKNVDGNAFIKAVKGMNSKATVLGIGLCAGLGALTQPLNIYMTKKKTGQSGFVGGGSEDKSLGFKALKTGVASLAMFGALASITKGKFKEIPEALKFKGLLPTIEQFKLVYGITIFSRLASSRNSNELREGAIKDSLGFVNWLILGSFVQKFAAMACEKASKSGEKFIKNAQDANPVKRFLNSEVISRAEVLQEGMKKLGKSSIQDGKAMSFKQMHKVVNEAVKNGQLDKAFKGKLKALNFIQLAGYAYSGLVLGVLVPKLNIAITKHFQQKQETKAQVA